MRRILLLVLIAVLVIRKRRLDDCDRQRGFGPYADTAPIGKDPAGR